MTASTSVNESIQSWSTAMLSTKELKEKFRCFPAIEKTRDLICGAVTSMAATGSLLRANKRFHLQLPTSTIFCTRALRALGGVLLLSEAARVSRIMIPSIWEETKFKRLANLSQGKETIVVLLPEHDTNFMSHLPNFTIIQELAKEKKIVFQRVGWFFSIEEILKAQNNISHLWIRCHGTPFGIALSKNEFYNDFWIARACPVDRFLPGAQIILESCSTGANPCDYIEEKITGRPSRNSSGMVEGHSCFAERLQHRLKTIEVIAPTKDIEVGSTRLINGQVRFFHDGEDCTARFSPTWWRRFPTL